MTCHACHVCHGGRPFVRGLAAVSGGTCEATRRCLLPVGSAAVCMMLPWVVASDEASQRHSGRATKRTHTAPDAQTSSHWTRDETHAHRARRTNIITLDARRDETHAHTTSDTRTYHTRRARTASAATTTTTAHDTHARVRLRVAHGDPVRAARLAATVTSHLFRYPILMCRVITTADEQRASSSGKTSAS